MSLHKNLLSTINVSSNKPRWLKLNFRPSGFEIRPQWPKKVQLLYEIWGLNPELLVIPSRLFISLQSSPLSQGFESCWYKHFHFMGMKYRQLLYQNLRAGREEKSFYFHSAFSMSCVHDDLSKVKSVLL